tara:strand:+ start:446 stop:2215 length:1770 start_codon:yes stop_codon:yes gene_type:complete
MAIEINLYASNKEDKANKQNSLATDGTGNKYATVDAVNAKVSNVDNTSDADKPVSTATQTALNAKQATLVSATNIKTVNGSSLVGSGNLSVASTGVPVSTDISSGVTDAAQAGAVFNKFLEAPANEATPVQTSGYYTGGTGNSSAVTTSATINRTPLISVGPSQNWLISGISAGSIGLGTFVKYFTTAGAYIGTQSGASALTDIGGGYYRLTTNGAVTTALMGFNFLATDNPTISAQKGTTVADLDPLIKSELLPEINNQFPIGMLASGDSNFLINASVIGRAGGTLSNGQPITWSILNNSDNHNSSFYRYIIGSGNSLSLKFPPVKTVLSSIMTGDETIQGYVSSFGSSTGLNETTFFGTRPSPQGFQLRGNATNWTSSGNFASKYSLNNFTAGLTDLNLTSDVTCFEAQSVVIVYAGSNNYRIERVYSGLSGSAGVGFYLVNNATNTRVLTAPTTSDYVHISGWGQGLLAIGMQTWSTGQFGNSFMYNNNFWTSGLYELWMKCIATSDTSILAKWQSKSGVTAYTLKRSTAFTIDVLGNYVLTSPTTIYTGSALEFEDTGLNANTMYYYQLLDQTTAEITQFNIKTK